MSPGALVCVPCGINIATGRSIATAEQGDTERTYEHARGILWFVSWILILGMVPISSEAHGTRRPHALRFIAILTIFFSMWMWWFEWTDSPRMHVLKNQMLWAGNAKPDAERIEGFYHFTGYGDYKAFESKKMELAPSVPESELAFAALSELPPSKRCFGEFHVWQLITHAFLHADFLHLGGNLLFLFIFGSRINALIGNVGMLLLYPILAIVSGLVQMASMVNEMPSAALGASGAIFGLAGMYFVLFPVSPVHVAAFIRVPILLLKFFKCRGFWILLFYVVVMNALPMALGWEDGTAHWAHMGGFMMGIVVALALVITRGVNARGTDLISVLVGQRAWNVIGKPSQWLHLPEGEGWLTRLRLIPAGLRDEVFTGLGITR